MPSKAHSDLALSTAQRTTIPSVPFRTAMFDSNGNMTRTWILFFEQLGGAFTQILNGGGAGLWGGVNLQTASYAAQATDDGVLIAFEATSAVTFQLPSKPPSTTWKTFVANSGTGVVTLLPNGAPLLDGVLPGGTLEPDQGVYIATDGTNYFTERGLVPAFETNGTPNVVQTLLNLVAGANVTITDDGAGDITIASTASGSGSGGVNLQTASYTAVAGDSGKLISFNWASAVTLTLPATPPSATWNVSAQNTGAGELTIKSASANLDQISSHPAYIYVCQDQGVYITTDGTNYYTERGGPLAGTTISGNVSHTSTALLTIAQTGTANAEPLALQLTTASHESSVALMSASDTGYVGTILEVNAPDGNGIVSTLISGGAGGAAVAGAGGTGTGVLGTNNHAYNAALAGANANQNGPDLLLAKYALFGGVTGGGVTFANLPVPQGAGALCFCSDAKNFHDDAAAVGSVAVSGGHGAMLAYVNATWRTLC